MALGRSSAVRSYDDVDRGFVMAILATPLTTLVGVEITGSDVRQLVTPAGAGECRAALARYGVVVHRGIGLRDDDLVAFSRMLGEVVPNPTGEHVHPEIATITLDPQKTNATLARYRRGNFEWHIDGMTDELPQQATLLSAQEVDDSGGDTEFASTYVAYETLSDRQRAELEGLRVVHSFAASQTRAHPDATAEERAAWDRLPRRTHPLVWKRRDGRRSILLGATAEAIEGWPEERGRRLLDGLLAWTTRQNRVYRHRWTAGDLVIWDNTGMLHRATPFEATSRRLMHRTTLVGTEPTS
jgi:alpha-ketoglutarate-dependent taurine dioxygenase